MGHTTQSGTSPAILIIERDEAFVGALVASLGHVNSSGGRLSVCSDLSDARAKLSRSRYDIVLVGLQVLGDRADAQNLGLKRLVRAAQGALLLAFSDDLTVSHAVSALQAGAHDVLGKPIDTATLRSRIAELGHRHGKARALGVGQRPVDTIVFEGFTGNSEQMQAVFEQIERVAASDAPAFLIGEPGTGKQVCAEALHRRSARVRGPFVTCDCAKTAPEDLERKLFGIAPCVSPGLAEGQQGALQRADGGVLMLNEIGAMELGLQIKLLRFLQTGTFTRLGDGTSQNADVRVVCATSVNPMQLVNERRLREDLFYRLHAFPIQLPPLRHRPSDILPLAEGFLAQFAAEHGKVFTRIRPDASDILVSRDWPGNVRQLRDMIARIAARHDGPDLTPEMICSSNDEERAAMPLQPNKQSLPAIRPLWLQERDIIEAAIARCGGNVTQAAEALEISPSTIYRKRQQWSALAAAQMDDCSAA